MSPTPTITAREHLCTVFLRYTRTAEYGMAFADIVSGKTSVPPQGARFDISVEGRFQGAKLQGTFVGVDYLHIRTDGRAQMHLHHQLTTEEGEKIALSGEGVGGRDAETGQTMVRVSASLLTASAKYAWVNSLHIWGQGETDPRTGELRVELYSA